MTSENSEDPTVYQSNKNLNPTRKAPSNAGKTWTEKDIEKVILLLKQDKALPEIAEAMGRTEVAIIAKMEYIYRYHLQFIQLKREILKAIGVKSEDTSKKDGL